MSTRVDNFEKSYFFEPYRDLFFKMSDAVSRRDYSAYINLVEHLENMAILALTDEEQKNIREIRETKREFVKALNKNIHEANSSQTIIKKDFSRAQGAMGNTLRLDYIEYPLTRVIERVCIHALKRTVLKTQVSPEVSYCFKDDLAETLEDMDFYLPDGVGIEND